MTNPTRRETWPWHDRCAVMGIVNVTPDSFSGDGLLNPEGAVGDLNSTGDPVLVQIKEFVEAGVDIIDIGGESTRPGGEKVGADEELQRVIPSVMKARATYPDLLISIDTYKAEVAEKAIQAGADIINDVWGGLADPDMFRVAEVYDVPIILMHNRSAQGKAIWEDRVGGVYEAPRYDNFLGEILDGLRDRIEAAKRAGISTDRIIVDPGVGFGKTVQQNLMLIGCLDQIGTLGYPVLLGPSRKSFIGKVLGSAADDRLFGTAAAISVGVLRGADLVRVHDVEEMVAIVRMTEAISSASKGGATPEHVS